MKTEIFAQIYNPITADSIYKFRKKGLDLNHFLNSDIFATAFDTAVNIYKTSIL